MNRCPNCARSASALGRLALLASVVALLGCGGAPVISGKVTYRNQPLTTGEISFIAPDGKSRSGLIGLDGGYEVRDAPIGPVAVMIVATRTEGGGKGSALAFDRSAPAPITTSFVPLKYNDPKTSGLTLMVARGKRTLNLDLED